MTFSDYLFDSILVLLVVRQLRESRLGPRAILLPLGIVAVVANDYLHTIPTAGNDLELIAVLTVVGVLAGTVSGLATRVRSDGGRYPLVKAGWVAAGTWVLSMSARFAFAIWASHGSGEQVLGRFSVAHHITGADAWTAAIVLMALGEVLVRTAILVLRGRQVTTASRRPVVRERLAA